MSINSSSNNTTSNNNNHKADAAAIASQEQVFRVAVDGPRYHTYSMTASQLQQEIAKANKAVKRTVGDRRASILSMSCIRKEDKASCSINPFRKINSLTVMPSYL